MSSTISGLAISAQLSVLALSLEAKCCLPQGWPADDRDDELFANYVAIYALRQSRRHDTRQFRAAADKLRSMRLPSGLWRSAHSDVEPTARAAVALQLADPGASDLSAALFHIQHAQLKDGGWALQGTDVVLNPNGELGPSLPCTYALHLAYQRSANKTIEASLGLARTFFQKHIDLLKVEAGRDAKTDLAYAWAMRGLVHASTDSALPDIADHRQCLGAIVRGVLQRRQPPDDIGFQLLFNALHALALLDGPATVQFDLDEAVSCLIAWALLRNATGVAPTRWLAGALLTGSVYMARRYPHAALSAPTLSPAVVVAAPVPDVAAVAPPESFVATVWFDFLRRPAMAQVKIISWAVVGLGPLCTVIFGWGLQAGPRLDEDGRKVVERLAGHVEVIVTNKSTGQPVADASVEVRPAAPDRIWTRTSKDGKANLSWNLVDPASAAVRMEVLARVGTAETRQQLADKPGPFIFLYVP